MIMRRMAALWILLIATMSVVIAIAVSHPTVQGFIENSGVNIPTENVVRDYAWGVSVAILLLLSILFWPVPADHKKMLAGAWLSKCAIALVVMLPYEERYWGADCWVYFQRSHFGLDGFLSRLTQGGSELVIALGALFLKVGPDSYHAMKVVFAMVGLLGVYWFYRAAEMLLGRRSPLAFWTLTLYPSILFWSSILGKDPLILAAIGLHVLGLVGFMRQHKSSYLFLTLVGIVLASAVRIWMGPILIAPCLLILWARVSHKGWRILAVALASVVLAMLAPVAADRLAIDKAADLVAATRSVTVGWDQANSALRLDVEINSLWDLALFTPQSMFIAFFRPLPGDVPNIFGWLAGFENMGLLTVALWALFRLRVSHFRNPLLLWALALVLTWGLAYSVVAYKDLGTASRFKLQILPVLLGVIGFLIRRPTIRSVPAASRHFLSSVARGTVQ